MNKNSSPRNVVSIENLKNETPVCLGKISDINGDVPVLNQKKLKKLCSDIYKDIVGKNGFINSYFSQRNFRYHKMLNSTVDMDGNAKMWEMAAKSNASSDLIPFTPIIAVSGGYDSGLVARLTIDAYKNRSTKEKTDQDLITIINFNSKYYSQDDTKRGKAYSKYLFDHYSKSVPIRLLDLKYPVSDIEKVMNQIIGKHKLFYGEIQNLPMGLTNTLITLPSEDTGLLVSVDTTNLTEFLLDEVTNGSSGGTNLAVLSGLPKTLVIAMCDILGIGSRLNSENSTTWESKVASYLDGAKLKDTKRTFHAIDTILYLAINEGKTINEIITATNYGSEFVKNVFARTVNHSKRFHGSGQYFRGDFSPLDPKKEIFFRDYFSGGYTKRFLDLFGTK